MKKQGTLTRLSRLLIMAAAIMALLLTGCGGSGGSGTSAQTGEPAEGSQAGEDQDSQNSEGTAAAGTEETEGADGTKEAAGAQEGAGEADEQTEEETDTMTGKDIYADITVDGYGVIKVKLEPDAAPNTVENFVNLAESGFYDGLTFHRIISGFMIQGGDPLGNGTGGSDKTIIGEFEANHIRNTLSHKRGVISMARSQDYNSASSQFFIVHEDSTFLDGQYAAFGEVTEGMDVVDSICADAKPVDNNGTMLPDQQPVIKSIVIQK